VPGRRTLQGRKLKLNGCWASAAHTPNYTGGLKRSAHLACRVEAGWDGVIQTRRDGRRDKTSVHASVRFPVRASEGACVARRWGAMT
jgi:hypothetical protein